MTTVQAIFFQRTPAKIACTLQATSFCDNCFGDPMDGHWKFQGGHRGVLKAKTFKGIKYEAKQKFPAG